MQPLTNSTLFKKLPSLFRAVRQGEPLSTEIELLDQRVTHQWLHQPGHNQQVYWLSHLKLLSCFKETEISRVFL